MRKYHFTIIFLAFAVPVGALLAVLMLFRSSQGVPENKIPIDPSVHTIATATPPLVRTAIAVPPARTIASTTILPQPTLLATVVSTSTTVASNTSSRTATIIVDGASFSVEVARDDMVIDAMQTLSERGELSFTTTGFPSMGVFIDAINGRENAGGMYWILYINGTSSPVGASAASIEVGDVVEWKYKKGGMY